MKPMKNAVDQCGITAASIVVPKAGRGSAFASAGGIRVMAFAIAQEFV
jgi:hypothetical protein